MTCFQSIQKTLESPVKQEMVSDLERITESKESQRSKPPEELKESSSMNSNILSEGLIGENS